MVHRDAMTALDEGAVAADVVWPAARLGYAWYAVFVLMTCYTLCFSDRQISTA